MVIYCDNIRNRNLQGMQISHPFGPLSQTELRRLTYGHRPHFWRLCWFKLTCYVGIHSTWDDPYTTPKCIWKIAGYYEGGKQTSSNTLGFKGIIDHEIIYKWNSETLAFFGFSPHEAPYHCASNGGKTEGVLAKNTVELKAPRLQGIESSSHSKKPCDST